jgi:hypothetical protein
MQAQDSVAPHFAAWFFALFAVTQIPLYWVQYPDIVDFPNHLARLHVLMHLAESETLQRYYAMRKLQIGTNLAMEVVVPALAGWMTLALALKVFASLAMLLVTTGAAALGRAVTGRVSYLLLGVLLFAHNAMFHLGLLNYLFGVGAALWLLSAWIFARHRGGFWHWVVFAAGCILVYLCHLSALGVYAVGVLGYELGRIRARGGPMNRAAWQALVLALTQFLPVAIGHVLVSTSAGSYVPTSIGDSTFGALIVYKVVLVLLAPLVSVSGYRLDQTVFGFLLVLALYIGFRERALQLAVPMRWMASGLAVAIALLPPAGFGSNLVDIRLSPALGLVLWSGLELSERSKWMPKVVLGVIAAAVILISLETTRQWVLRDDEYRRVRTALAQVPEGSKIATIMLNGPAYPLSISPHTGAWSIIDRSAFLSSFYIWPFQPFWVAYREPFASLAKLARTDDPAAKPPAYTVLKNVYDYVLVFGGDKAKRDHYAPNAETILDSPSLRILRTGLDQRAEADATGRGSGR